MGKRSSLDKILDKVVSYRSSRGTHTSKEHGRHADIIWRDKEGNPIGKSHISEKHWREDVNKK